jgi:hypothetical protein
MSSTAALTAWQWLASLLLALSLAVHLSTFLGVDPMEEIPGVMLLHVLIFIPFVAAALYVKKIDAPPRERRQVATRHAPLWLRIMAGVFFAYAIVNFALFIALSQGGVPTEEHGKYVLSAHGHVIRKLTERELHQQQAGVVRGFSGHWMVFSSAALVMLTGVARVRKDAPGPA